MPFLTLFGWEGSPKIDYRKKSTLILTSLLEDLVGCVDCLIRWMLSLFFRDGYNLPARQVGPLIQCGFAPLWKALEEAAQCL